MQLEQNHKLLFVGDSITDCNRSRPFGEGLSDALGTGYVALVNALIQVRHPSLPIRVVNMGVSGNTVRDLKARWQSDVLDLTPDWLSIMIGINDVWRQYDSPSMPETHVGLKEYEDTLADLVLRSQNVCQGILVLSPFFIEPRRDDPMRHTVDQYRQAAHTIAHQQGCQYVDMQAPFDELLRYKNSAELSWDRVHPNLTGHLLIATTMMDALERSAPQPSVGV